jgi:hypothetical protein
MLLVKKQTEKFGEKLLSPDFPVQIQNTSSIIANLSAAFGDENAMNN